MQSQKKNAFLCLIVAGLAMGLIPSAAAQTGGNPFVDLANGLQNILSAVVNPRMGKMASLLAEHKFVEADQYYESERDYFFAVPDADEATLAPLARYLNDQLAPQLTATTADLDILAAILSDPADHSSWLSAKNALSTSDELRHQYLAHSILTRPKFRSTAFERLDQVTAKTRKQLTAQAEEAFCSFDVFSAHDFAAEYPVTVDMTSVVRGGFPKLSVRMMKATPQELRAFNDRYGKLLDPGQSQGLAQMYLAESIDQITPTLVGKWGLLKEATAAGFDGLSRTPPG